MPKSGLTTVQRPDSFEEENRVLKVGWHLCAATRKREELFFPVGAAMSGHPSYTPLEVMSIPCPDCHVVVSCWFEWSGSKIIDLGAK